MYSATKVVNNSRVTTATDSYTTISPFTTSPSYTSATTASSSYTTAHSTTTASSSYTTAHSTTTASSSYTTAHSTTTASSNYTTAHSTTTSNSNYTLKNGLTAIITPATFSNNQTVGVSTTHATTAETQQNQATNHTTVSVGQSTANSIQTTQGPAASLTAAATTTTTTTTTTTEESSVITQTTETPTTSTTTHDQPQTNTATAKGSLTTTTTLKTTTLNSPNTNAAVTSAGINSITTTETTEVEQANELLNQTSDVSKLNSTEVEQLVGKLEELLDAPSVSQDLGKKALSVISNLMVGDSAALSSTSNRLIHMVDDLGLKMAVTDKFEIFSTESLVLAVRTVDWTNFPTTSINIVNTHNVELRNLSQSRLKKSDSAMGSVFLPSSLTASLSLEEQQQASRVQFTFYTKSVFFQDASLNNEILVSPVLSSSVANLSISNLTENIEFTIKNSNPIHANYVACAFWNFSQNGGDGGWSHAGCSVVNNTSEETTCSCNHLTAFAILLDVSRQTEKIDPLQVQILTFITYIGCGISTFFLGVTLITHLLFEKLLRDIPAKILVQLCLSLLLLNVVFLLNSWLALYDAVGLCISTAFFLHYFLLSSFTWAGLEALHMYLSIIRVFTPYLGRYMLKFSLMGWGIPFIVVTVVISVDKNNYGPTSYGRNTNGTSNDFCWIRNDKAFYVGVVGYYLLIFVLCLLVFITVMVQLARIKRQNPHNQSPNRGVMSDLRSICGLVILLGLTWGFALFAWGPLYLPFIYFFTILNSLQGFLVFVFHCAVKENVRRQWRTYLCCGKLRLAENSEWSRMATQNNKNTQITRPSTSDFHFASRSSSVASAGTNGSGSVFADSGISEGANSDVVLNEIHRRNQLQQGDA
ncbi:adhesion G-protein coupled receptor G2 [Mugil cephalus]|uniref:adhesion G-protein coupled receptor G2 n=1 Tax=Mugil cephalus TaxID=48193 RepID=UPI001FB829D3|nr:adhesion G-protein coupled receptor G2 [Mugil cephalus]